MKKLFSLVLAFVLLFCASASGSSLIPKFTNHVMKYNSVASQFGAEKLYEDDAIEQDGYKIFVLSSCYLAFEIDENEEIQSCAVNAFDKYNPDDFLKTCVSVMSFLGEMDFTAYGFLLYQYINAIKGEEGTPGVLGSDAFGFFLQDDNTLLFNYYNADLKYWY